MSEDKIPADSSPPKKTADRKPMPVFTRDGLVNVMSGLGTLSSKRKHNIWHRGASSHVMWEQLENVYKDNWIAQAAVDVPAMDMTKKWRKIEGLYSYEIAQYESRLKVQRAVQQAIKWSRLYGGGAVFMVTDQDLSEPLDVNKIKAGSLQRLISFSAREMRIGEQLEINILSEGFMKPEHYYVGNSGQRIHRSHFAFFQGIEVPLLMMRESQGWGDSILRKCLEEITDAVSSKTGVADLLQEINVDIIRSEALASSLLAGEDEFLIKRYDLFSRTKSIINMGIIDKEDEYERKTLQLSGVAPILDVFMSFICGATRMPASKLFGSSPQGLNATGEGDLKTYYDDISAQQSSTLLESMSQIDEVLVRSALGHFPDDFQYKWVPLIQLSDIERTQDSLIKAQRDQIFIDLGVISVEDVRRRLEESDEYSYLEPLDDFEETEEIEAEEPAVDENRLV